VSDARAFSFVCAQLEEHTSLDRLEARGTGRIALKDAGLETARVTAGQMDVVLARVLPSALATRGVEDARKRCREIAERLARLPAESGDGPDEVFARLGGAG
jgi:hypothetical protein